MWHPRRSTRIFLGVAGVLVVMIGLAAWALETEYGGNSVAGSETSGGVTRVFDADEQSSDEDGQPITTIVFEGTEAEARAFMEQRWNEGRNYTIPLVVLAIGGMMILAALSPSFTAGQGPEPTEAAAHDGQATL